MFLPKLHTKSRKAATKKNVINDGTVKERKYLI